MALQKVVRNMLSTGVSDSSDATAITIDSSENVGIGLTNQANKLQVDGDICIGKATTSADLKSTLKMRGSNGSNELQVFDLINDGENGRVDFAYNRAGSSAQTIMTFGATVGNVGIGTTSPSSNFHVKDTSSHSTVRFEGADNNYKSTLLISSASSGDAGIQYDASNNTYYQFSYGDMHFNVGTGNLSGSYPANERMVITQGGNVGIGTTSPSYKFEVSGTGGTRMMVENTDTNWAAVDIRAGGNQSNYIFFKDDTEERARIQVFDSNDVAVNTGDSPSEKLRLLAAGGLTFNGDTAAANALDDYEEGSWTPRVTSTSGTAFTGASATYTKIGRLVTIRFDMTNNTGTSTSIVYGIPFTSNGHGGVHITWNNQNDNDHIGGYTNTGSIQLLESGTTTAFSINNGERILGFGLYFTD